MPQAEYQEARKKTAQCFFKRAEALALAALDWTTAAEICAALSREARETAEAVEAFSRRIEKIGVIYEMRRYAVTHATALPGVDLAETVHGLRTSAGCLCLMGQRPEAARIGEQNRKLSGSCATAVQHSARSIGVPMRPDPLPFAAATQVARESLRMKLCALVGHSRIPSFSLRFPAYSSFSSGPKLWRSRLALFCTILHPWYLLAGLCC